MFSALRKRQGRKGLCSLRTHPVYPAAFIYNIISQTTPCLLLSEARAAKTAKQHARRFRQARRRIIWKRILSFSRWNARGRLFSKRLPLAKTLPEENRKCTCEFLGTRVRGKPFLRNGFLLKKISEKPLQHFYHAAGVADCDGVGGYVFGDDGACADDGAFADRDSGQNGDSAREPAVAAYDYGFCVFYVI